ncbi:hypothetical protein GOBAR_AA26447 [Gossypium barbadense]|uniref:Uncharacterized protein n=1 Tax=Gossypium barbadense TaxID=3634 RepID=A0A2P5WT09_GOSBA|nr:hypothetical protein GOBAR_AA26447 [Gossypium barbadense]
MLLIRFEVFPVLSSYIYTKHLGPSRAIVSPTDLVLCMKQWQDAAENPETCSLWLAAKAGYISVKCSHARHRCSFSGHGAHLKDAALCASREGSARSPIAPSHSPLPRARALRGQPVKESQMSLIFYSMFNMCL